MSALLDEVRCCEICGSEDRHFLRDAELKALVCFECWDSTLEEKTAGITFPLSPIWPVPGCYCFNCVEARGRES